MSRSKTTEPKSRRRHSTELKREALLLAERVGVKAAAEQLGVHDSELHGWRSEARRQENTSDEAERRLAAENTRLKRLLAEKEQELAITKKAAAYFARELK